MKLEDFKKELVKEAEQFEEFWKNNSVQVTTTRWNYQKTNGGTSSTHFNKLTLNRGAEL